MTNAECLDTSLGILSEQTKQDAWAANGESELLAGLASAHHQTVKRLFINIQCLSCPGQKARRGIDHARLSD